MPYNNRRSKSSLAYNLARNIAGVAAYKAGRYLSKKLPKGARKGAKTYKKSYKKPLKINRMVAKKPSLRKEVRALSKKVNSQDGTLIYHNRNTSRCLASQNQLSHVELTAVSMNSYETVLAELRFFDSATPNTLVQASGASATYQRDYLFESSYTLAEAVNNYQVPCICTAYICTPREDTSISPVTAYTDGLTDVGAPSSTSPLLHLTDSTQFNDLWRIARTKKKLLMPGQRMKISYSNKNIMYSPAVYDTHSLTRQRRFGCYDVIFRCEGVLAHDTIADQQGFSAAGVDLTYHTKFVVKYDAGIDLRYIVLNEQSDAMTTSAVVSEQPIADNIAYSVV